MDRPTLLTHAELEEVFRQLPGWSYLNGKLHREYQFKDFVHAFGFLSAAAIASEAMNHHPEWFNVYNRVVVDLATHDAGGITELDVELASKMEQIARKLLA
ncbi:MAG: 4a-hydroxytetrahydrobiopterin dehydratase [Acidobacteria bacterium]|nr:4a-hydroxytetrahydrobiopterin dehydratase [Acidobacteriota bacterium]